MKRLIFGIVCCIQISSCCKDPDPVVSNPDEYEFYDGRIYKEENTNCGFILSVNYFYNTPSWYQKKLYPINLHDSFKTYPPAVVVKGKIRYLKDSFSCVHDGSPSVVVGNGKYKYQKVEIIWLEKM